MEKKKKALKIVIIAIVVIIAAGALISCFTVVNAGSTRCSDLRRGRRHGAERGSAL